MVISGTVGVLHPDTAVAAASRPAARADAQLQRLMLPLQTPLLSVHGPSGLAGPRRSLSQWRKVAFGTASGHSSRGAGTASAGRFPGAVNAATAEQVSAFEKLAQGTERKYILVSGKGGVGKTSLSASLAAQLAAAGHTTLVVSTDPAHSLGDSLAQDVSGGKPVLLQGSDLPLWGMEINPEKAKEEFKAYAGGQGKQEAQDFLGGFGVASVMEQLSDLKLGDLLDTAPPGFDEAVSIAKVVEFVNDDEYARFSRIVFDTAPTGHTLRFLTVPEFVDTALQKVIVLRKKLAGASSMLRGLFGAGEEQDAAVAKLEKLRESILMVKELFRNAESTEFVIATIPTVLGISESSRLLEALRKEGIPCNNIVVNQVISESMGETWIRMKLRDQQAAMAMLQSEASLSRLQAVKAPFLDLEARGLAGLEYFGTRVWGEVLPRLAQGRERKYYMLGGKGGVGKTSSAASLGVKLAREGHTTLVVSTDPAHSLSDALDQDVSGGKPVPLEGTDLPLYGMEIDIEAAKAEIRELASKDDGKQVQDFLNSVGLGGFSQQLKDLELGELLDTPPPGVDEAVAISKVVQFLKSEQYSKFTRIVFDTAPTGHTLRLLTLPDFLDTSIGKVVRLRQRLMDAANAVKGVFGAKPKRDPAAEKLDQLKERMEEAKALFRDPTTTEFIIVSIPTVMAMAESARLSQALTDEHVPVQMIVVNQVVDEAATPKFLQSRRRDQQRAMEMLRHDPGLSSLNVTEGPLLDLEVRGLPALTYFGKQVWK